MKRRAFLWLAAGVGGVLLIPAALRRVRKACARTGGSVVRVPAERVRVTRVPAPPAEGTRTRVCCLRTYPGPVRIPDAASLRRPVPWEG